ncbi:MAG: hypothetical protein PF904_02565 [Kiritimatiellae bacterium]|nr:hypothetical protein [Kiritimatiellia bacterium]
MITTSIMTLVVIASVGSWVLYLHKSNRVINQIILDLDSRNVVERFRSEMRNAARETIIFYPENAEPYEAIGFALAQDTDGDGLMDMDATGSNILWRVTVIYHIWDKEDIPQMRRTEFSNRNNDATTDDYYQQLATVVSTGEGNTACLSGEISKTSTMFENLFSGKLWHADSIFDAYAPEANTLEKTTFGSLSLKPGAHTLEFTPAGKHPDSSGYNIRVDQLSASVTGWPLEAENCKCTGGLASPLFIGPNQAAAAYGLLVTPTDDNDKISFKIYNDAIEESEFIGNGRNVSMSNTVVQFDEEYNPEGFASGTYVTKLDGRFETMWTAAQQSGYYRNEYFYPETNTCAIRVPIMAPYVLQDGYGPVFRLYKGAQNGALTLENPCFAIVENPDPDNLYAEPPPDMDDSYDPDTDSIDLEFYQFGIKKSSWAVCEKQNFVDLRPTESIKIGINSTLMLSFVVKVVNLSSDGLTRFGIDKPNTPGCWIIEGGDSATVKRGKWSTDSKYDPITSPRAFLPALEFIAANYADSGEYISNVYDAGSDESQYKTIEWLADIPSGTEFAMYARSGNLLSTDGFKIADAPLWETLTPVSNGDMINGSGRYFQFRTVMKAQPFSQFPGSSGSLTGPYRSETPRLQHVLIKWNGESKYVDVTANLLKSPDCGRFKVEVDGKPLIKGVTMEIEVFKDVPMMGSKMQRLRSAVMAEVEPRNSQTK